jgi:hypothetical protein
VQEENVPYFTPAVAITTLSGASGFFSSSTWHFIMYMLYFFLVVFWLSIVYWVLKDARRRIADRMVVTVAVLAALIFPVIGVFIYMLVRPAEALEDAQERELEMRVIEARLREEQRCGFCKTPVREDFLICPKCQRRLRSVCPTCHRPVESVWKACPYCETQIVREPSAPYGRARR